MLLLMNDGAFLSLDPPSFLRRGIMVAVTMSSMVAN